MSGESIRDSGSWVDLEASGGSITNNSFGAADDAGFSLSSNGGSRPHLEFELELAYGSAPTANTPVALHHAPQTTFGGANHARDPSANNLGGYLARVLVENTTSTQRFRFDLLEAPTDSKYWLRNVGTGQTISSGWKLRARAWGLKAAP